jgi:hypothetical protein
VVQYNGFFFVVLDAGSTAKVTQYLLSWNDVEETWKIRIWKETFVAYFSICLANQSSFGYAVLVLWLCESVFLRRCYHFLVHIIGGSFLFPVKTKLSESSQLFFFNPSGNMFESEARCVSFYIFVPISLIISFPVPYIRVYTRARAHTHTHTHTYTRIYRVRQKNVYTL